MWAEEVFGRKGVAFDSLTLCGSRRKSSYFARSSRRGGKKKKKQPTKHGTQPGLGPGDFLAAPVATRSLQGMSVPVPACLGRRGGLVRELHAEAGNLYGKALCPVQVRMLVACLLVPSTRSSLAC